MAKRKLTTQQKKDKLRKVKNDLARKLSEVEADLEDLLSSTRAEHEELIVKHLDALLELVKEHDETDCSDKHTTDDGECSRCSLLNAKKEGVWDSIDLALIITVRKVIEESEPVNPPTQARKHGPSASGATPVHTGPPADMLEKLSDRERRSAHVKPRKILDRQLVVNEDIDDEGG